MLEQQSGGVSITLNDVSAIPEKPVELVATPHRESGIADPDIEDTGPGLDRMDEETGPAEIPRAGAETKAESSSSKAKKPATSSPGISWLVSTGIHRLYPVLELNI